MSLQLFSLFPWLGGLNTADHEAMLEPGELKKADNIIFTANRSKKKREGIDYNWAPAIEGNNHDIAKLFFYQYLTDTTLNEVLLVALKTTTTNRFYTLSLDPSSPTLTAVPSPSGTEAWSVGTDAQNVWITPFNNWAIVSSSNSLLSPLKIYYDSGASALRHDTLGGSPPKFSISSVHQGRLFTNDLDDPNKLHFSAVGDPEKWNGADDSGYLIIGDNDGDPDGITAIFPTFMGDLFVAKRTKLYRISGTAPENWVIRKLSDNIGCLSQRHLAQIGTQDVVFTSWRGIHSLATTSRFGDFEEKFLSRKISDIFRSTNLTDLLNAFMFYFPDHNGFGIRLDSDIYFFNVLYQAWYRWKDLDRLEVFPGQSSISIADVVFVPRAGNLRDKGRLFIGFTKSFIAKTENGTYHDVATDDTTTGISSIIRTGRLPITQNPFQSAIINAVYLYGDILGADQTVVISMTIDNFKTQTKGLTIGIPGAKLGVDFILGQSILSGKHDASSYPILFDGVGRTAVIEIQDTLKDQAMELVGLGVEFKPIGTPKESTGESNVSIS